MGSCYSESWTDKQVEVSSRSTTEDASEDSPSELDLEALLDRLDEDVAR